MTKLVSKSDAIYNMHSYWTKQPVEVIKKYIALNTLPGDCVLDCFAGTGMTGLAASLIGRDAILCDLSPICCHIAHGYCDRIDPSRIEMEFKTLKKTLDSQMLELYSTRCSICGKISNIDFVILGDVEIQEDETLLHIGRDRLESIRSGEEFPPYSQNKFSHFEPLEIVYRCDCSKGKCRKIPDEEDFFKFNDSSKMRWIPDANFFGSESKRNIRKNIIKVSDLHSKRNLTALSIIFDEINKIEDEATKNFFFFIFTSILFNCSLMSVYRDYENTSIRMGTLYVPSVIKDNNVFDSFCRKFDRCFKTKLQLNKQYNGNVTILNKDSTKLNLKKESIDYAYVDPPYSDIINYSQLNIVWEAWIGKQTLRKNEIIVNSVEGKELDFYQESMTKVFKQVYTALKNKKRFTMIFHHPKVASWMAMQQAVIDSNFIPCNSDTPERIISSSKTSSQIMTNKLVQSFMVLNFKKIEGERFNPKIISEEEYEALIIKIVKEAKERGFTSEPDQFDYLMNILFCKYKIADFNPHSFL